MKRFFCFCIFCCSLFCFCGYEKPRQLPIEFEKSNIQIYTNTQKQNELPYKNIKNGNGLIYFSLYKDIDYLLKNINGVSGVTYILHGDYDDYCAMQEKLNVKIIEKDNNSCVGFSECFDLATFYKSKKVNVQMCIVENTIYIGSPLILGCY